MSSAWESAVGTRESGPSGGTVTPRYTDVMEKNQFLTDGDSFCFASFDGSCCRGRPIPRVGVEKSLTLSSGVTRNRPAL